MFKPRAMSVLLFACPLVAQADGVESYEDYAVHLRAAQEVTPLTSSEFGDQVSLYNGATEFNVVDIDVPGNNALPVQLRRRFAIQDHRTGNPPLTELGEWDVDVPYLEGVFASQFGWQVQTSNDTPSYNRCTNPAPPYTYGTDGQTYAIADVIWDGYQMHMPGGGFQDLLKNTQAQLPGVTDGNTYPWITKNYTRVTCLPSLKNASQAPGYPGEGFLAVSPDGTKTWFDWAVVMPYSSVNEGTTWTQILEGYVFTPHYATRSKVFLLASRQQDRFGNWVTYSYATNAAGNTVLTGITSSDGRWITPTYNTLSSCGGGGGGGTNVGTTCPITGQMAGADSNVGTWSYGYVTVTAGTINPMQSLNTVTRPDGSKWTYTASSWLHLKPPQRELGDGSPPPNVHCQIDPYDGASGGPSGTYDYIVGAPLGASATYHFSYDRHYRSYVPLSCINDGNPYHAYPTVYDFVDNFTILSKQVTGPGLTPQAWTYDYAENSGTNNYFSATVSGGTAPGATAPYSSQTYVPQGCPTCALSELVTVTGPTEITKYTFGVQYAHNEGRLLGTEVDGLDGTPLRTTTNSFVADSDVGSAGLPFPSYVGTNLSSSYKNPMAAWMRPQQQSAIVQDGVTFTNQTKAWDVFANPTSVTKSSALGYSKTENTTYAHNTTRWVIGQVASVADTTSVQPIVYNAYDPTSAMLTSTKSFGVLQKTLAYNGDGTLKTVADGAGHITTLSNFSRGVPQSVQFADGTTEDAVVNDAGWITSLTVPIGATPTDTTSTATTAYGYDPMGRVNLITYPTPDTVAWTPTTVSFAQIGTAEFGVPAGHWKHVVTTGASRKTVYYDALLRPLLQRDEDTSNAATIRYTEQSFDAANRALFTSYPSATASAYNDLTLGTHASFDGLGRPTSSAQDSELTSTNNPKGLLTTRYAYLPSFLTQVTNPRSQSTTTAYQVFDSPDTSHPVAIASPMGVSTNINRDVFGKPLSITRSGTSNSLPSGAPISEKHSYVYDTHQRLCKRVEPETGATLMDYDAANNVAWMTSGSTLTTVDTAAQCETDRSGISASAKIVHGYDLRNRPLTETIPGSTNIAYSYFNDGELRTLTSGTGSTANTWAYTYNKRRLPVTEQLSIDSRTKTITHGYDALGHENKLTYPSGLSLTFQPNALAQPTYVKLGTTTTNFTNAISYFPNGGMSGFKYGNGIIHTLTQNARELPQESRDMLGTTAILDDTYTYDQNANVTVIDDGTANAANNGRTMGYDALDRLYGTNAPGQPWGSASTTYDALDNIRTSNVGSRRNIYAYDPTTWHLSGITGGSTYTLGYDAFGNVTSKGTGLDSYVFDAVNRMQSVVGKESYVYDGYGRRVKVTTLVGGALQTDYPVYTMGGQLLTEDDQRINKTTDYISLNGSLVAKRAATIGTTSWVGTYEHTDALHSPVTETNSSGAITYAERYTPYGEPSDGSYTQGPGFTGHVTDAFTGLTYAQQRYYDPVIGRFLSTDPVQASDNGASFNRYWYANNNPYKFTDADGRETGIAANAEFNMMGGVAQTYTSPDDKVAGPLMVGMGGLGAVTVGAEIAGMVKTAVMIKNALSDSPSALTRAKEIQGALSPRTQRSVTTAVTETKEGPRIVTTSEGSLRPAQRAALQPGEIAGKGVRGTHAEVNGVNAAKSEGLTPTSVSPSRPACTSCQQDMQSAGVVIKDK